jgi:hypothetical protein
LDVDSPSTFPTGSKRSPAEAEKQLFQALSLLGNTGCKQSAKPPIDAIMQLLHQVHMPLQTALGLTIAKN